MKSKISKVIILTMVCFFPVAGGAQTADEIIAKHIEAHGGEQNWGNVEALRIAGKFTAFSLENDYTCFKTKDGSYYADLYLGEKRVIESIHENDGWTIDPWQEMEYARKLNSGELNALMQKAEFFTPFLTYREKGHSVEYTGMDTIDGMAMHVLKLTRLNGKTETWYLNANTFLEYKCESEWVDFGMRVPAESYFDDFQNVDGLIVPFFVERTFWQRDRILLIEDVEINPEIDLELFEMPRREEMEKLAFLQGSWDVTVEVWTRRGAWYNIGTTTSAIDYVSKNMLQEQITYERVFLFSKTRNFAYSDAGSNYRVSEYDDLSTAISLFEGRLTDTTFVFDDVQIRFGNIEMPGVEFTRYTVSHVEKDSFILEKTISMDGGETWSPRDRFTYVRKKE